jgi:hypothetical protein
VSATLFLCLRPFAFWREPSIGLRRRAIFSTFRLVAQARCASESSSWWSKGKGARLLRRAPWRVNGNDNCRRHHVDGNTQTGESARVIFPSSKTVWLARSANRDMCRPFCTRLGREADVDPRSGRRASGRLRFSIPCHPDPCSLLSRKSQSRVRGSLAERSSWKRSCGNDKRGVRLDSGRRRCAERAFGRHLASGWHGAAPTNADGNSVRVRRSRTCSCGFAGCGRFAALTYKRPRSLEMGLPARCAERQRNRTRAKGLRRAGRPETAIWQRQPSPRATGLQRRSRIGRRGSGMVHRSPAVATWSRLGVARSSIRADSDSGCRRPTTALRRPIVRPMVAAEGASA